MSQVYLNPPILPIPSLQFNGGDLFATNLSYTNIDHHHHHDHDHHHHHESLSLEYSWKVDSYDHNKSNDVGQASTWPENYMIDGSGCSNYVHSSNRHGKFKIVTNNNEQKNSKKWKPRKTRIDQNTTNASSKHYIGVRKFDPEPRRNQSKLYENNNNNNNNNVRVCVDCHTTATPLWRSGPQGPKTLCNACGIRQRKARRASMVAASVHVSSLSSSICVEASKPKVDGDDEEMRETRLHHNHTLPHKKRGKLTTFEDAISSNNRCIKAKLCQRASPRDDEEEGAILLMALSCGLACSS